MKLYHIGALIKIALWVIIWVTLYATINVYEDPGIGIGLGLVAVLLISWGLSFYLFRGLHQLFSDQGDEKKVSNSYKMSLLFWLFCLINVALLMVHIRTKLLWVILLISFILLHLLLFTQQQEKRYDR
jgi:hypothetical protein